MRYFVLITTTIAISLAAAAVRADEVGCNMDIDKSLSKLVRAFESTTKSCLSHGDTGACPLSNTGIDKATNRLISRITEPGRDCDDAINTGTPISSLGPGGTCPDIDGCGDSVGTIDDLTDLADCLVCVSRGMAERIDFRLLSHASGPLKCKRALYFATLKAMRTGRKQISRCARDGTQPFACALDDDPAAQFGRALTKIRPKIEKCTDSLGIPGVLTTSTMNSLCLDGPFFGNDDVEDCYADNARCQACSYGNLVFNQGQDCTEFSGIACGMSTRAFGATYVINAGNETITYFDGTPAPINGTIAASSFATGAAPKAVFSSAELDIVYVANSGDDTVTYYEGGSGAPLLGTLAASTFDVGNEPVDLIASNRVLWVVNRGDNTVTALHATSGQPMLGTLAASTFPVGAGPSAIAAANVLSGPNHERVVVTNTDDDTITVLDSVDVDYVTGDLAGSTVIVGDAPTAVSHWLFDWVAILNRNDGTRTMYKVSNNTPSLVDTSGAAFPVGDDPVDIADGVRFANFTALFWVTRSTPANTLALATLLYPPLTNQEFTLPGNPTALTANFATSRMHVVHPDSDELTTFGTDVFENAKLDGLCRTGDLLVDAAADRAYAICSASIVVIDATTPGYTFGDLASSSFTIPAAGPLQRAALDTTTGMLYVTSCNATLDTATLTFFDTTTLSAVGTPIDIGPIIGGCPTLDVAVDPSAGTVIVVDAPNTGALYLDALTGAFLGGTRAAATLPLGSEPTRIAVRPDLGIAYVIDAVDQTLTYIDSTAVDYLDADLASSTIATGAQASDVAVNVTAGLTYVSNRFDDTVTFFDDETVAYASGTMIASTHPAENAIDLVVDEAGGRLFVLDDDSGVNTFTTLDAVTGAYFNGTVEESTTWLLAGGEPMLAYNPASDTLLYAAGFAFGTQFLMYDSALKPLGFGPTFTSIPTGPTPIAIATPR